MSKRLGLSLAEVMGLGIFGLFLVVGLGSLGKFWKLQHLSRQVQAWPSVPGKVLSASIEKSPGSKSTLYSARIVYDYEVAGRRHRGHRVYLDAVSTSDFSDAQAMMNAFPVGQTVLVYYDPAEASESVLRRGSGGGGWILALVGGAFTLMGVGCPCALFLRSKPSGGANSTGP